MRTTLFRLSTFVGLLLSVIAGCSEDKNEPDQIILSRDVSEIIFNPGDAASQNIAFSSTSAWTVGLEKNDWVEVTPMNGPAGDAVITIKLIQTGNTADREITATISAGTAATVSLRIIQKASKVTAQSIRIVSPQKRLVIGQTVALEVETEPSAAILPGEITWSSSDASVVSVDSKGIATAVLVGTAVVTARSGDLKADYTLEVTEVFTTDGEGKNYTFTALSSLEGSGVQTDGGDFVITANLIIATEDTLSLNEGEKVRICDNVEIRILGKVNFTPDNSAEILPYDNTSVPAPLYFTGDAGGGQIRNVTFTACPIRFFGSIPLTIENCTFKGIADAYAAINLGGSGQMTVSGCNFLENGYPAIMGGANMTTPLLFKDNYLYKNSNNARNRPQINVTVAGDSKVEITGNTVVGPGEITTNGGIAVANLLGIAGSNEVLIQGNKVSDCRYGITTNGVMDVRIIDNTLENNKWDSNPMNGGSGVSIYNAAGGQKIYMSGNTISGHLWGITNIGNVNGGTGPSLNLGNLTKGNDYNPGGNVFRDNGNGGILYDLYNNSPLTVYAQGNTWNVTVQDEQSIEQVIYHQTDNPQLGKVIFMPAAE